MGKVDLTTRRGNTARRNLPGKAYRRTGVAVATPSYGLTVITSRITSTGVIKSFRCVDTKALADGLRVKRFVNIASVARRKLRQLQIAGPLHDLRIPPGNRLEELKGKRAGQHSIRVNDQFRICFRWTPAGAEDVEITDYH